ncbi:MAG: NADH-quinone oxidoreductase subunit NuoE [Pseudomonadota bacterium]
MLRRLHPDQPESFAFTPENRAWAEAQITKYPKGREASAIIPLLWRAQEQEGWLSRPAIEHVAEMLGLAHIRALEVATFYFMFQLAPVGAVANIQVCGTTTCMICGSEDLVAVCKEKIAKRPHTLSADGKLSWEEVECLGACTNAPMAQIGKDYYEDLTSARLSEIIDALRAGDVPLPGPQNGRYAAEPLGGATALTAHVEGRAAHNASVALAAQLGETVKLIDGTEEPLRAPWGDQGGRAHGAAPVTVAARAQRARPSEPRDGAAPADAVEKPPLLAAPRGGQGDDLTRIKGIGPKLAALCHGLGVFHFDQIASWNAAELAWIDAQLDGFQGRAQRDDWVGQAKRLAEGAPQ